MLDKSASRDASNLDPAGPPGGDVVSPHGLPTKEDSESAAPGVVPSHGPRSQASTFARDLVRQSASRERRADSS